MGKAAEGLASHIPHTVIQYLPFPTTLENGKPFCGGMTKMDKDIDLHNLDMASDLTYKSVTEIVWLRSCYNTA